MTDDDAQARLAAQLRELRTAAGLSGTEASLRIRLLPGRRDAPGISQSKISKLELGALRPSPRDVADLCDVYGVAPGLTAELVQLAETLRTGILEPPRVTLSRGARYMQQRIRRLEASVSLLRSYQPAMVIGLLQTTAYASIVFGTAVDGAEIDAAVAARVERQVQMRDQIPHAVLLMAEGALRWPAGGPQVMLDQITAIRDAVDLPNVEIGIIPYSARGVDFYVRHGFHLYDSDAVIWGSESGTATITDGEDVARYEHRFAQLTQVAAMGDAAKTHLDRIASDYRALL